MPKKPFDEKAYMERYWKRAVWRVMLVEPLAWMVCGAILTLCILAMLAESP